MYLLLTVGVKEFRKSVNCRWRSDKKSAAYFLLHCVGLIHKSAHNNLATANRSRAPWKWIYKNTTPYANILSRNKYKNKQFGAFSRMALQVQCQHNAKHGCICHRAITDGSHWPEASRFSEKKSQSRHNAHYMINTQQLIYFFAICEGVGHSVSGLSSLTHNKYRPDQKEITNVNK